MDAGSLFAAFAFVVVEHPVADVEPHVVVGAAYPFAGAELLFVVFALLVEHFVAAGVASRVVAFAFLAVEHFAVAVAEHLAADVAFRAVASGPHVVVGAEHLVADVGQHQIADAAHPAAY